MSETLGRPIEAHAKVFHEVLLAFADGKVGNADAEAKVFLARLARIDETRPRIGRIIQHIILNRYEEAHPEADVTAVDWTAVIEWLVENLPTILKMILSILAIFGL